MAARGGTCGAVLAVATVLAAAADVRAAPPDVELVLAPGAEKFLKPGVSVTGVAWEPPGALTVEPLPSDELFVQVKAEARGEVLLLAAGTDRATVYRICVGDPAQDCPKATSLEEARPKCPTLAPGDEDGEPVWRVTVKDDACLGALLGALARAPVLPSRLRVSLDEKAVFAYAGRLKRALESDAVARAVRVSLLGPMLRLEGDAPRETVARALLVAWRHVPGRLAFEDATRTLPSSPDAPRLHSPFVTVDPAAQPAPTAAPRSTR